MIKGIHYTEIDIEIPFHDIDMMEVVWHGHYAKYFEISRYALLEKLITTICECLIRAIHSLLFTLESSI